MNIRKSLLAATVLSTVVAVAVWAGVAQGAPSSASDPAGQPAAAMNETSVAGISARSVVGAAVHNSSGQRIGEIHDLIVAENDRPSHTVIDVSGLLGLAEKRVLMPLDELTIEPGTGIVVSATRQDLEARPAFTYATTEDFRIHAEESSDLLTSEDRRQFVEETDRQLDEWDGKVREFTEEARQTASETSEEAAREVGEAWDAVQRQWRKLKDASVDAWESGKESFEDTWREFENTWNEAETRRS